HAPGGGVVHDDRALFRGDRTELLADLRRRTRKNDPDPGERLRAQGLDHMAFPGKFDASAGAALGGEELDWPGREVRVQDPLPHQVADGAGRAHDRHADSHVRALDEFPSRNAPGVASGLTGGDYTDAPFRDWFALEPVHAARHPLPAIGPP